MQEPAINREVITKSKRIIKQRPVDWVVSVFGFFVSVVAGWLMAFELLTFNLLPYLGMRPRIGYELEAISGVFVGLAVLYFGVFKNFHLLLFRAIVLGFAIGFTSFASLFFWIVSILPSC